MPVPLICPCSAKLRIADRLKGMYIKCPRCGAFHAVGSANGHAPAPARDEPEERPTKELAAATTDEVLAASALSEPERDALLDVLEEGEQVVWADKPDAAAAFRFGWFFGAAFAVFGLV